MGKRKKSKKRGIFFPAKHRKLAEIVTIESPAKARKAVKKLKRLIGKGYTKKQIRGAMIIAYARAKALAKKKGISAKEKRELRQIAKIYLKAARSL